MSESKKSGGSEVNAKRSDIVQQRESMRGDRDRLQNQQVASMKHASAGEQETNNDHGEKALPKESLVLAEGLSSDEDSEENDVVACDGMLLPTVVRASAGTGKTYQLTARLMRILLQGAPPESILATTFTRKAAGEILDRVLLTLAHAANESDPAALEALREQVAIPTLPRSACLQMFDKLLRNVHRLRICTLDSLFSQLARSFSFELGLPPAWRLTDEIEEVWLREQAVDALIATLDPAEMMALLSMLGKGENRRSIARELLQVVDTAYSGQRQCGLKVWEKLAAPKAPSDKELAESVAAMRSVQLPQKRLMTRLEKLAQQIEAKDFAALADDTLIANIATARRLNTEVKYFRSPFPEELDGAFDTLYAAVRTNVLGLLKGQNVATGKVLDVYNNNVTDLKQSARVLGFEDVSIRLASRFASLDQRLLGDRMDGAINHVLLDEFQDTSPVQWQVLRPLAMRVTNPETASDQGQDGRSVRQSFFCVGDTKQAIYGWRGGVAEIFDAVADQIPDVVETEQNKSYRSSQVIVDVVNQTFKNLMRHPIADVVDADPTSKATYEAAALKTFCRRFPEHKAFKQDLPGHVQVMTSANPENSDSEMRQQACYERAASLVADLNRNAPRKSIGILTRTNRGVAQLIFMLENLGVEVSQEGGNPLTDAAAVETILSTLMMAEHPGDGRWEFHARSTPLGELTEFGPDYVRDMVEERGLAESIEFFAGVLAPACDGRETLRLKQLTRLAISYQMQAAPRIRDFVRLVREKRVERPQMAPVRVMTVHQSKGLEFDAVVLPELDGALTRASGSSVSDIKEIGEPPEGMTRYLNQKAWHFLSGHWQRVFGAQAAGGMTEALCLLYVAMTRARQGLYIIMQPAKKSAFDVKTGASLVYHALGCELDPTENNVLLYEHGDVACWADTATDADAALQQDEGETENPAQHPVHVRINLRSDSRISVASNTG